MRTTASASPTYESAAKPSEKALGYPEGPSGYAAANTQGRSAPPRMKLPKIGEHLWNEASLRCIGASANTGQVACIKVDLESGAASVELMLVGEGGKVETFQIGDNGDDLDGLKPVKEEYAKAERLLRKQNFRAGAQEIGDEQIVFDLPGGKIRWVSDDGTTYVGTLPAPVEPWVEQALDLGGEDPRRCNSWAIGRGTKFLAQGLAAVTVSPVLHYHDKLHRHPCRVKNWLPLEADDVYDLDGKVVFLKTQDWQGLVDPSANEAPYLAYTTHSDVYRDDGDFRLPALQHQPEALATKAEFVGWSQDSRYFTVKASYGEFRGCRENSAAAYHHVYEALTGLVVASFRASPDPGNGDCASMLSPKAIRAWYEARPAADWPKFRRQYPELRPRVSRSKGRKIVGEVVKRGEAATVRIEQQPGGFDFDWPDRSKSSSVYAPNNLGGPRIAARSGKNTLLRFRALHDEVVWNECQTQGGQCRSHGEVRVHWSPDGRMAVLFIDTTIEDSKGRVVTTANRFYVRSRGPQVRVVGPQSSEHHLRELVAKLHAVKIYPTHLEYSEETHAKSEVYVRGRRGQEVGRKISDSLGFPIEALKGSGWLDAVVVYGRNMPVRPGSQQR